MEIEKNCNTSSRFCHAVDDIVIGFRKIKDIGEEILVQKGMK